MIWLFKVNEVFWNNKPKVNDYYTFDTEDTEFDIIQYDVPLYFGLANYYLLNELNDNELYYLQYVTVNKNPMRILVSKDNEIYNIIRDFYVNHKNKVKQ
jgi:hypothetical protein